MCLDKPAVFHIQIRQGLLMVGGGVALGAHHHPMESVMVLNCSLAKAGLLFFHQEKSSIPLFVLLM